MQPLLRPSPVIVQALHPGRVHAGSPEDDKGPNDPGNPSAIIYREVLFRGPVGVVVRPGETVAVEGIAFSPEGTQTQKQIAVKVGG